MTLTAKAIIKAMAKYPVMHKQHGDNWPTYWLDDKQGRCVSVPTKEGQQVEQSGLVEPCSPGLFEGFPQSFVIKSRASGNAVVNNHAATITDTPTSKWRDQYKVHPAADVFPMMDDAELAELGEDIKKNGLRESIKFRGDELLDGRNRLEAIERAGVDFRSLGGHAIEHLPAVDAVAFVISVNIQRRHLTKQQQADLIVAAVKAGEKPPQVEEVSKGGRGKVNPVKAAALKHAVDVGISKATVERAIAKAEGKAWATSGRKIKDLSPPRKADKVDKIEQVQRIFEGMTKKERELFFWWVDEVRRELGMDMSAKAVEASHQIVQSLVRNAIANGKAQR
jgi:hypothetical protein